MTACGNSCYAASEMVSGHICDELKTNLWSCGIIMYAMICGYLPFEDPDAT
jgi:5'-AMP-activated protein kinase catalytic alpha subunit